MYPSAFLRHLLCLAVLVLTQGAAFAEPKSAWYVGDFVAEVGPEVLLSVTCSSASLERCEFKEPYGPRTANPPGVRRSVGAAILSDLKIPKHNWAYTRSHVQEHPNVYLGNSGDSAVLRGIKPALESNAEIEECINVTANEWPPRVTLMCRLSKTAQEFSSPLLVVESMGGRCGSGPFCGALFFPLQPRK